RDAFDAHFASDFNFVEPARVMAKSAASAGVPVYLYRFDYITESKRKDLKGAPHASDVPYVFDHLEASGDKISDADRAQAQALQPIWISSAKGGVPQSADGAAWNPYAPNDDKLYAIGADGVTIAAAGNAALDAITQQLAPATAIAPAEAVA